MIKQKPVNDNAKHNYWPQSLMKISSVTSSVFTSVCYSIIFASTCFTTKANATTAVLPKDLSVKTVSYNSIASDNNKKIVYKEKHSVKFEKMIPTVAKTEYLDSDDKLIAEMTSDFTKNLTTPEYTFIDLRTGESHGIVVDDKNYTLWRQTKGQKKEQKIFTRKDLEQDGLVIGCQGLHYYLISNLSTIQKNKSTSIKYFMPGRLDYYRFNLTLEKEDNEFIYLKLKINNIFLKMFTDALELKYSKTTNQLIKYNGLSNITNENGDLQNVAIEYTY